MVYAFLIVSVSYTSPKILFSQRFTAQSFSTTNEIDNSTDSDCKTDQVTVRETIKAALELISQRIATEYNFAISAGLRPTQEMDRLNSAGSVPELSTGMFICKEQPPYYTTDKHIIWCGTMGLIFALVIESNENRGLASIVLKYIAKYVDDYMKVFDRHMEICLKPHVIMQITHKLIPCGQLAFMNHKFIKHTEKELEQLLTKCK